MCSSGDHRRDDRGCQSVLTIQPKLFGRVAVITAVLAVLLSFVLLIHNTSIARRASVYVPRRSPSPLTVTLRLAPSTTVSAAPRLVSLRVNGNPIGEVTLKEDQANFGRYAAFVPAGFTRRGRNRVDLIGTGGTQPDVVLWYMDVGLADSL